MQNGAKRKISHRAGPILAAWAAFSIGCAGGAGPKVERACPKPTALELEDWNYLAEADEARRREAMLAQSEPMAVPYRPVIEWVSRLVAYCWPDETARVEASRLE